MDIQYMNNKNVLLFYFQIKKVLQLKSSAELSYTFPAAPGSKFKLCTESHVEIRQINNGIT